MNKKNQPLNEQLIESLVDFFVEKLKNQGVKRYIMGIEHETGVYVLGDGDPRFIEDIMIYLISRRKINPDILGNGRLKWFEVKNPKDLPEILKTIKKIIDNGKDK